MKIFISVVLTLFLKPGFTQVKTAVFPRDFVGQWQGSLEWMPITKPTQTVNMELGIHPVKDSIGLYTWHLVYGSALSDSRPYRLKQVDTSKAHWVIDELNGIIIDQYYVKGRLVGAFTVQNSTIVSTYTLLDDDSMCVEFISYTAKPFATTGKGSEDSPLVDSYEVKSIQKAILKRKG